MNAKAALLPDRSLLEVAGEDRVSFLQGLVTNDVEGLSEGEARFTGLLSPQGKILFDFFIVPVAETLLIDCPSAITADLAKRLAFYRLRAKVTIADLSEHWQVGAVWGDGAAEWAKTNAALAYPDPRFPMLGLRVLFRESDERRLSASFDDYEAMRVALAVPEGGKDYAYGDPFPHEACFDLLHGVSFKKGCFVLQALKALRSHGWIGSRKRWRRAGFLPLAECRLNSLRRPGPPIRSTLSRPGQRIERTRQRWRVPLSLGS